MLRCVKKEVEFFHRNPSNLFTIYPNEDEFRKFTVILKNIPCEKFFGKKFQLEMILPSTFPYTPPDIKFQTPIDCRYVRQDGRICLDILSYAWSPVYTLEATLVSICSLLSDKE
jgi:peroxin-4